LSSGLLYRKANDSAGATMVRGVIKGLFGRVGERAEALGWWCLARKGLIDVEYVPQASGYRHNDRMAGQVKTDVFVVNSLNYKVANFKAIDGLGGLDHSTEQSKRVQKRYCAVSDSELRRVGVEAVGRALDKYSNGT
jgi:hypothetical protein